MCSEQLPTLAHTLCAVSSYQHWSIRCVQWAATNTGPYGVCSEQLPTLVCSQNMTARLRQRLVALLSNSTVDNVRTYVRTALPIVHTMAALGSNVHSATERDAVATYCNGHKEQKKWTKCHLPRYTGTHTAHCIAVTTWRCITLILHDPFRNVKSRCHCFCICYNLQCNIPEDHNVVFHLKYQIYKLLIFGMVTILEIGVITSGTVCCIQTHLLASQYPERINNFSIWNNVFQKMMNGFVNFVFIARGCDTVGTVMWCSLIQIFRLHRKLINKASVPSTVFCNTTKIWYLLPVR